MTLIEALNELQTLVGGRYCCVRAQAVAYDNRTGRCQIHTEYNCYVDGSAFDSRDTMAPSVEESLAKARRLMARQSASPPGDVECDAEIKASCGYVGHVCGGVQFISRYRNESDYCVDGARIHYFDDGSFGPDTVSEEQRARVLTYRNQPIQRRE